MTKYRTTRDGMTVCPSCAQHFRPEQGADNTDDTKPAGCPFCGSTSSAPTKTSNLGRFGRSLVAASLLALPGIAAGPSAPMVDASVDSSPLAQSGDQPEYGVPIYEPPPPAPAYGVAVPDPIDPPTPVHPEWVDNLPPKAPFTGSLTPGPDGMEAVPVYGISPIELDE